jgi:MerR family transcriptional regulator, copper efflux regulator
VFRRAVQAGVPAEILHEMGAFPAGKPEPRLAVVGGYAAPQCHPESGATCGARRDGGRVERQSRRDPDGIKRTPGVHLAARVFDAVRCRAGGQTVRSDDNALIVELEPATLHEGRHRGCVVAQIRNVGPLAAPKRNESLHGEATSGRRHPGTGRLVAANDVLDHVRGTLSGLVSASTRASTVGAPSIPASDGYSRHDTEGSAGSAAKRSTPSMRIVGEPFMPAAAAWAWLTMTRSDTTAPSVRATATATLSRATASARLGQSGTVSTSMFMPATVRVPARWKVKGTMRIGELAAVSGVTAKTIRYYEDIGVLDAPARTPSGYRNYTREATDRLGFIRSAQAVGLTLGEIRGIVALRDRGATPCAHVLELITARAADLDRRISQLQRLRTELGRLVARAKHLDPADCDPRRVCHLIDPNT